MKENCKEVFKLKYRQSHYAKLIKKLAERKKAGVESVKWILTPEAHEHLSKLYEMEPCLYIINTRTFSNIWARCKLFKKLHYSHQNGTKTITLKELTKVEQILLKDWNIPYKVQYTIHLQSKAS